VNSKESEFTREQPGGCFFEILKNLGRIGVMKKFGGKLRRGKNPAHPNNEVRKRLGKLRKKLDLCEAGRRMALKLRVALRCVALRQEGPHGVSGESWSVTRKFRLCCSPPSHRGPRALNFSQVYRRRTGTVNTFFRKKCGKNSVFFDNKNSYLKSTII